MMQTWPSWEHYEQYLRDERSREAAIRKAAETFCHHGRSLVSTCEACGIEAQRMEDETSVQFCADDRDLTGEMYAYQDATEIRAWCEDGTLLAVAVLNGDQWEIGEGQRAGEVLGADLYDPRTAAYEYIQAARLNAVRIEGPDDHV
jgi:hypothetical protein